MTSSDDYELIADLDAPGGGNWQCAARNSETGEWFVAHSRTSNVGGGEEDVYIYRFRPDGTYRDKMTIVDGGHVYGFGVSDSNILWITHNGDGHNDVITISYRPGKSVGKGAGTQMHMFTDGDVQVSFSPTRAGLVVMQNLGRSWSFTKRLKADVLANVDDPRGHTITRPKSVGTLQGFSVAGEYLYLLYGRTDEKAWLEKWSFADGDKVGSLDVTRAGLKPGERGKREPEGMDGRTFGVKVFTGSARRLRVYRLTNF